MTLFVSESALSPTRNTGSTCCGHHGNGHTATAAATGYREPSRNIALGGGTVEGRRWDGDRWRRESVHVITLSPLPSPSPPLSPGLSSAAVSHLSGRRRAAAVAVRGVRCVGTVGPDGWSDSATASRSSHIAGLVKAISTALTKSDRRKWAPHWLPMLNGGRTAFWLPGYRVKAGNLNTLAPLALTWPAD